MLELASGSGFYNEWPVDALFRLVVLLRWWTFFLGTDRSTHTGVPRIRRMFWWDTQEPGLQFKASYNPKVDTGLWFVVRPHVCVEADFAFATASASCDRTIPGGALESLACRQLQLDLLR